MRSPLFLARRYLQARREWDDICDRCGRCCFVREVDEDGDVIIDYADPCPYLDVDSRQCTVYERRFETCDQCRRVTPFVVLFGRHLPEGCAYLRYFEE